VAHPAANGPKPRRNGHYLDGESLLSWATRRVGQDFLENILEPFFRVNWAWEPEDISKAYFLPLFAHSGGRTKVFTFKGGIGLLCRTLAARLPDIRYGTRVTEVARGEAGVVVHFENGDGGGRASTDIAVCAVQGSRVPSIVPDLDDSQAGFFADVRYTRLGMVHYVLSREPPQFLRYYTRRHPGILSYYAQSPMNLHAEGYPHRLHCELTPQSVEAVLAGNGGRYVEGSLDAFVRPHVLRLYPALAEDQVEVHEQWWDEMLCAFYPGYIQRLAGFLQRQRARRDNLYFAGDYLAHSHTGGACASGRDVAALITEHWGHGQGESAPARGSWD
jgi:oxygen-dependent protoporphyrinogen oxidase